jgi:hypothetical protein
MRLRKDGLPDRRAGRHMPSVNLTHGHRGKVSSPTYRSWRAMKARCLNPKNPAFKRYGGRSIAIHEPWLVFENFLADMGERPPGLSLERSDNSKGYSPDNCVWATRRQQGQNMRSNNLITADGITKCLAEWARDLGVDPAAIRYRLNHRWSAERAVTEPKRW